MEQFQGLLLDVWREACQHIEIAELVDRIAPILWKRLPIDAFLLRRVDRDRGLVETLAAAERAAGVLPERSREPCAPAQIDRLLRWFRAGKIAHGTAAELAMPLAGLIPGGIVADVLAGPLKTSGELAAALILVARPSRRLAAKDEGMVEVLLEPLAVALENDQRVRELTMLREAVEAENRALRSKLGRGELDNPIVGAEAGLRAVMERVDLVATSDVPVLIFGETGTGKEVVARAIHTRSRRAQGPVLRVNCGAIPAELVDSELFGHEKGSFTGAVGLRKGWFERADGGTLFLDEIGELPLAAQVRLLRILQDGVFERVGGERQIHVDVRIVAATNRDLPSMVAEGTFREDLWYRLAVFPVRIPPLRERIEDIAPLAGHFAQRAANRLGMPPLPVSADAVELLAAYPWPGNVRELRAVIERAAILGNGKTLEVAKALGVIPAALRPAGDADPTGRLSSSRAPVDGAGLPFGFSPAEPWWGAHDTAHDSAPAGSAPAPLHLDDAMARHIEAALARTRGRIDGPFGAARLLAINPHTLRARMRKLGIDWKRFRVPGDAARLD